MSSSLVGCLVRKKTFGDWAIGTLRDPHGAEHTVVGDLVSSLECGKHYAMAGVPSTHKAHGARFTVTGARPHEQAVGEAEQAPQGGTMTLTGTLIRKQVFGDWAIGVILTERGQRQRITGGAIAMLEVDSAYRLTGVRRVHRQYGEQVEVSVAVPYIGAGRDAVLRYLRKNFRGVGQRTAEQIIAWHEEHDSLDGLRKKLAESPWELQNFTIAGTKRPIQFNQVPGSHAHWVYTQIALHHGGHGVSDPVLRRLATRYLEHLGEDPQDPVGDALQQFRSDPYAGIQDVWGYGFVQADAIGGQLGIERDAPCRLAALVHHTLRSAVDSAGHTFLPLPVLVERVHEVDPSVDVSQALAQACQRYPTLTVDRAGHCYPDGLESKEDEAASLLRRLLVPGKPLGAASEHDLFAGISKAERAIGVELDESQLAAVAGLLTSPVKLHTLTAGPGRGKTSIMEIFAQLVRGRVRFCAPTGKAAKVLYGRVSRFGYQVTTIHQLLEPTTDGFARDASYPLAVDAVVLDEASMTDLPLLLDLLRALPAGAHLILVGDDDQLPSVGPGEVLASVLRMPADHHQLQVPHRNRGQILQLVNQVREGAFTSPDAESTGTVVHFSSSDADPATLDLLLETYQGAVHQVGIQHCGLLVAKRRGRKDTPGWNTTFLNAKLQGLLNPEGRPVRGTEFREGDRVIVRRNMLVPDEDESVSLVNGDTGALIATEGGTADVPLVCVIHLDDGRTVKLPADLMDQVALAYAMTIHAAQGSEYRIVIVLVTNGHPDFIHRRVLYTAVSRARETLYLFGDTATLRTVARRPGPARYSALASKVLSEESIC